MNNPVYSGCSCLFLFDPVCSCLFLSVPVCVTVWSCLILSVSLMLWFHREDFNFFTLEFHILDRNSLNIWISYMISEFLLGKKKCIKCTKKEKRRKMQQRKEKINVNTWKNSLFLLYFPFISSLIYPLFLLYFSFIHFLFL